MNCGTFDNSYAERVLKKSNTSKQSSFKYGTDRYFRKLYFVLINKWHISCKYMYIWYVIVLAFTFRFIPSRKGCSAEIRFSTAKHPSNKGKLIYNIYIFNLFYMFIKLVLVLLVHLVLLLDDEHLYLFLNDNSNRCES